MSVSRIPFEIWGKIFLLSVQVRDNKLPKLHPDEGPLLLLRISRTWRDVATKSPHLWTHLAIPYKDDKRIIPLLRMCLAFSSPHPLTISLVGLVYETERSEAVEPQFVNALCAHVDRWKSIRLRLWHDSSVQTLSTHMKRYADIFLKDDHDPIHSTEIFEVKPSNNCDLHTTDDAVSKISHGAQFFHLRLSYPSTDLVVLREFLASLSAIRTLTSLDIDVPYIRPVASLFDGDDDMPTPQQCFLYLRSLNITTDTPVAMEKIVAFIFPPNLQSIRVAVTDIDGWYSFNDLTQSLQSLLRGCASSLETVGLSKFHDFVRITPTLMFEMPCLKSIIFREALIVDEYVEIFEAFTLYFSPTGRLRGENITTLQHFQLDVVMPLMTIQSDSLIPLTVNEAFFGALVNMIRSRSVDLPDNPTTFDGRRVQPLLSLSLGPGMMETYRLCSAHFSASTRERWDSISGLIQEVLMD
ncbi:uncharacterized protein STEHIDRAFT_116526 [Stereum hirsutum FP-91666 SS1]|uniref:F-box domain-containing protein n=1 Tax=Stereum hirsutum (strain FP-91666) TaxID=721885 RepID=R7RW17_STEHR|nr:uncharacterized protein STEHIDRAFT_116526 [Stereum hirsutum FP-91666 SS1]EIM79481.1 hypothetical protein STEHIDRAFT_116526 [Stereum hirsutum FP-91666 SS1]